MKIINSLVCISICLLTSSAFSDVLEFKANLTYFVCDHQTCQSSPNREKIVSISMAPDHDGHISGTFDDEVEGIGFIARAHIFLVQRSDASYLLGLTSSIQDTVNPDAEILESNTGVIVKSLSDLNFINVASPLLNNQKIHARAQFQVYPK